MKLRKSSRMTAQPMDSMMVLVLVLLLTGPTIASMRVELDMPRYAARHGNALLKCSHNVEPEQLHKVEWLRNGMKIFQYVKGRTPPYRNFTVPGAVLDWSRTNDKHIHLANLDFSASGLYSCEVSMETPIYTKPSTNHELTVIQPQGYDPVIRFKQAEYQIGDTLEANCTTSPARPPPHITWLINQVKVEEHLTKSFSNGRVHGHGFWDRTAPSITQLSIQVSELHVGENGLLELTCMSTIPAYLSHNGKYADIRKETVIIEFLPVEVTTVELMAGGGAGALLHRNFLVASLMIASAVLSCNLVC